MYSETTGFGDMLADAESVPVEGGLFPLEVPTLGIVMARRPTPKSAAILAMAVNSRLDRVAQTEYFVLFVQEHMGEDGFADLLTRMMTDDVLEESVQLVARAIATWGTDRPYGAVVNLAAATASNWRTIRSHLIDNGIEDPIKLRSMHLLLDIAQNLTVDTLLHSGTGKDAIKAGERKAKEYISKLYRPDPPAVEPPKPERKRRAERPVLTIEDAPSGFDSAEEDFNAFMLGAR
jgi:hypothetical protein